MSCWEALIVFLTKLATKGLIITAVDDDIASKYTFKTTLVDNETGNAEPYTYNINADVSVRRFSSKGAPSDETLTVEYANREQFLGHDRFSGSIGGGRIYIKTEKGIKIKGEIEGGPIDGQTFVGSGTWTKGSSTHIEPDTQPEPSTQPGTQPGTRPVGRHEPERPLPSDNDADEGKCGCCCIC
jgi:hypothetical protein